MINRSTNLVQAVRSKTSESAIHVFLDTLKWTLGNLLQKWYKQENN